MRYVLALVSVGVAYLITLAAEHFLDLGVITALLIATTALALECGGLPPLSKRRQAAALQSLAALLPLLGLTHADPQWLRTTIALYAAYIALALLILRKKSTARRERL